MFRVTSYFRECPVLFPICAPTSSELFSEPFKFRDAETTILIKCAFWSGLGRGKFTENRPRNAVFFPEKFHDNKIGKFCEFYCQKSCCHLGGSYKSDRTRVRVSPFRRPPSFSCTHCTFPTWLLELDRGLLYHSRHNDYSQLSYFFRIN